MNQNNKQKNEKAIKQKYKEEKIISSLNEVKNPIRNSIVIAIFWLSVLIAFAIILHFVNESSWLFNFSTSFAIGLGVSVLWLILKLGLLESVRLKFKNWSNQKIVKNLNINFKNIKMNLDQFRELSKNRSWIGLILLTSICIIIFLITTIILYV